MFSNISIAVNLTVDEVYWSKQLNIFNLHSHVSYLVT